MSQYSRGQHPNSQANLGKPTKSGQARISTQVSESTKQFLIDLGGGNRRIGSAIEQLVKFWKENQMFLFAIEVNDEISAVYTASSHHEAYEMYRVENFGNGNVGYDVDVIGADYVVEF